MKDPFDISDVLNALAAQCHNMAKAKGFHDDHARVAHAIIDLPDDVHRWFESTTEQAEIARMHSELSEWLEGIRKPNQPDQHLPTFLSAEVEAADLIIRVLDTCGKRGYDIGNALKAKLEYNGNRPFKHGKNS